jgi:hypothetical protein
MYKNILLATAIAFITGCSKPQPPQPPSWYTTVPTDINLYYAVGASDTIEKATKVAISSMRDSLNNELNRSFENTTHKLQPLESETIKEISEQNADISKKLSLKNIKLDRSKKFKGEELVLISISRLELFEKLKSISDAQFKRVKQEYEVNQNLIPIKRFILLESLMQNYANLASLSGYKEFLISTYSADDEFKFLKNMKNEFNELKSTINIHVLTDGNSRIFSSYIKDAINDKGLSTQNGTEAKNSLRLLITSTTLESKDYAFNQSKSLIKFTTFDKEKNEVAFRQHTFIGKSAKSYKDAKIQASNYLRKDLKRFDILDFIGIK